MKRYVSNRVNSSAEDAGYPATINAGDMIDYAIDTVIDKLKSSYRRIAHIDIDDTKWNDSAISFDVIAYNKSKKCIAEDTFYASIHFEDGFATTTEDAEYVLNNKIGDFVLNFM